MFFRPKLKLTNTMIMEEPDVDVSQSNNEAWASVMANILGKTGPKNTANIILAKNKEKDEQDIEYEKEKNERITREAKKRKWNEMGHAKPDPLNKEHEKELQKIATKGVVQLFNAVRKHQKQLNEEISKAKTEAKKDKVVEAISKTDFLDMVAGNAQTKNHKTKQREEDSYKEASKEKTWSVLQDDFMMGNELKNWDKNPEET